MRIRTLAVVFALSFPAWSLTNAGVSAPIQGVGVANTDCPVAIANSAGLSGGTNGKVIAIQLPQWASSADIEIAGTFVATWVMYGSIDNTIYRAISGLITTNYSYTTSATGPMGVAVNGIGVRYVCVVLTAYTSGTAVVTIEPRASPIAQYSLMNAASAFGGGPLNGGTGSNQGVSNTSTLGVMSVAVADKSVFSQPGAAVAASSSTVAIAGVRHIATSCSVSISTVVAQPDIVVNLRDGASALGTVLWTCRLTCAINTPCICQSPPINILGSTNTAMTCETATNPAAGNFATATLTYHDAG